MQAHFFQPHLLPCAALASWSALEKVAVEPNAYQSPHFVLPALRHLEAGANRVNIAFVQREAGAGARKHAAVAVVPQRGTRQMPWPHLSVYSSVHSYLGSPLVDREHADETVAALIDGLGRRFPMAAGLMIPRLDAHGALLQILQDDLRRRGLGLYTVNPGERALLRPAQASADALKGRLGKKLNEIDRQRRRLAEQGEVQWHIFRTPGDGDADALVATFLRLEHAGWKGEAGSSLCSNAADEAFFREMTAGFFSEGRALFTELQLDGRAIASTVNFVSGQMGFAFKVGWDPAYRKYGPGILNEVELVRHARTACEDLNLIDSGAEPDSFIDALWPERRTLVTAFVPFHRGGDLAWLGAQAIRRVARRLAPKVTP